MRARVRRALFFAITCLTQAAFALPTVYVPRSDGTAWEVGSLVLRPRAKADGGVSIEALNRWLETNRGMKTASSICLMSFLKSADIVSSDAETEREIARNLDEHPRSFAEHFEPTPGRKLLARVGVFQDCAGDLNYMALVITDEAGQILEFEATEWSFIRLFRRDDGQLNVLGCYACGEVMEVGFDQAKNRVYYRWIGH